MQGAQRVICRRQGLATRPYGATTQATQATQATQTTAQPLTTTLAQKAPAATVADGNGAEVLSSNTTASDTANASRANTTGVDPVASNGTAVGGKLKLDLEDKGLQTDTGQSTPPNGGGSTPGMSAVGGGGAFPSTSPVAAATATTAAASAEGSKDDSGLLVTAIVVAAAVALCVCVAVVCAKARGGEGTYNDQGIPLEIP